MWHCTTTGTRSHYHTHTVLFDHGVSLTMQGRAHRFAYMVMAMLSGGTGGFEQVAVKAKSNGNTPRSPGTRVHTDLGLALRAAECIASGQAESMTEEAFCEFMEDKSIVWAHDFVTIVGSVSTPQTVCDDRCTSARDVS